MYYIIDFLNLIFSLASFKNVFALYLFINSNWGVLILTTNDSNVFTVSAIVLSKYIMTTNSDWTFVTGADDIIKNNITRASTKSCNTFKCCMRPVVVVFILQVWCIFYNITLLSFIQNKSIYFFFQIYTYKIQLWQKMKFLTVHKIDSERYLKI